MQHTRTSGQELILLKFFVEAKEASVDLVRDKDAVYQAKRYAI